jgi:Tol biopolymer transport system component
MGADGSGVTQLTTDPASDFVPDWSPDGARLAFSSTRDGDLEIYLMNADGSDVTKLTDNAVADNKPGWSPDGSRIAFHSTRDGNNEIYTMNTNGSDQIRLTTNPATDTQAAWQPVPPPGSSPVHLPGLGCGDPNHVHDRIAECPTP